MVCCPAAFDQATYFRVWCFGSNSHKAPRSPKWKIPTAGRLHKAQIPNRWWRTAVRCDQGWVSCRAGQSDTTLRWTRPWNVATNAPPRLKQARCNMTQPRPRAVFRHMCEERADPDRIGGREPHVQQLVLRANRLAAERFGRKEFRSLNVTPDQPRCWKRRSYVPTNPTVAAGQIEDRTRFGNRAVEQPFEKTAKSVTTDVPIPFPAQWSTSGRTDQYRERSGSAHRSASRGRQFQCPFFARLLALVWPARGRIRVVGDAEIITRVAYGPRQIKGCDRPLGLLAPEMLIIERLGWRNHAVREKPAGRSKGP